MERQLENGYVLKTTFWDDFCVADVFGESAIQDTFNRAFKEWKNNLEYVILSRQEDRSILIEFEWMMPLVLPRSKYEYHFKGGRKKVYRINEDRTKDWIR